MSKTKQIVAIEVNEVVYEVVNGYVIYSNSDNNQHQY